MKPFITHAEADAELEEAADYYEERRRGKGVEFIDEYEAALRTIAVVPAAFGKIPNGEERRFVMKKFPYGIVYREFDDHIRIYAVAHAKRRPGYWQHRLDDEEDVGG